MRSFRMGFLATALLVALTVPEAMGQRNRDGALQDAKLAGRPGPTRGVGKGIFINISNSNGIFDRAFDIVRADERVTGVQATFNWSDLEPEKGQHDWEVLDALLDQYGAVGKQVGIKFIAVGGKITPGSGGGRRQRNNTIQNKSTPLWLFDDPSVGAIGDVATPMGRLPLYPVYWDEAYLAHLSDFLGALADRYDGDPRLEYIRVGGWQVGTNEPNFYGGAESFLLGQIRDYGMDPLVNNNGRVVLLGDDSYGLAVQEMLQIWAAAFSKTRLAATIHFPSRIGENTFEEAMNNQAVALGFIMMNTGLNEGDHKGAREWFRYWHDEFGVTSAWGGITHLGTKLSQSELNQLPHSMRMEMFLQGLGDDQDSDYYPASLTSYAVFGLEMLDYDEEVQFAADTLAK